MHSDRREAQSRRCCQLPATEFWQMHKRNQPMIFVLPFARPPKAPSASIKHIYTGSPDSHTNKFVFHIDQGYTRRSIHYRCMQKIIASYSKKPKTRMNDETWRGEKKNTSKEGNTLGHRGSGREQARGIDRRTFLGQHEIRRPNNVSTTMNERE